MYPHIRAVYQTPQFSSSDENNNGSYLEEHSFDNDHFDNDQFDDNEKHPEKV